MTTPVAENVPSVDFDAEMQMQFSRLDPEAALQACDGHASGAITAVVKLTKGVLELVLCGNCARKFGYEHTAHAPAEDRQKGSVH